MKIDYKDVCMRLFGTTDINELEKIAKKLNDNRNAGRKRKFTQEEIKNIEQMLAKGVSINDIARKYSTSRQVISKYVNAAPPKNYTMRMTYMYLLQPCTVIDIDFLNEEIVVKNRTDDILHRAFGCIEKPNWQQFEEFLNDRCFPKSRGNLKAELNRLGIDSYDTLRIIEKTKGKTADDNMWIKINYYPQRRDV
jgi:hypothetical protein